jgi:hypothetical protein
MKRLVAAIVLVGTLSMASSAMAYGSGHNQPRDGKKYVEHRGKEPEFGIWFRFPQPNLKLAKRHREWEREKWEDHRHNGCNHSRPRHRS